MKKHWSLVFLAAWAVPGCVWLPTQPEPPKPEKPARQEAPAAPKAKRPTTLVTPEQVNEANAHEMSKALRKELDRDSQAEMGPP
jgi:hypothetical protein